MAVPDAGNPWKSGLDVRKILKIHSLLENKEAPVSPELLLYLLLLL
jgi:hypothetical protein